MCITGHIVWNTITNCKVKFQVSLYAKMNVMETKRHLSFQSFRKHSRAILLSFLALVLLLSGYLLQRSRMQLESNASRIEALQISIEDLQAKEKSVENDLAQLKGTDQIKVNQQLRQEIVQGNKNIAALESTFRSAVNAYENLIKLRERTAKTSVQDAFFTSALSLLAKNNIDSYHTTLSKLEDSIRTENARLDTVAQATIPANVPAANEPPSSGYRRQKVNVDGTDFLVDIVAADLNSTRVIIDTASDSTCANDCPVLPLADYVSRSGAYAGVNGSYFCPDTYPSCADKKNSFDTLLMNKNKVYFNSDNNVYSTVPVVVFSGNSIRVLSASQNWGRDTGVDAVIANRPLLLLDGNIMFTSSDEAKEAIRSNRSFVGGQDSTAYIGNVHGVTVAESAKVLHALGMKNAINLDSGGSAAMWSGGYKVGPGRNLPNVVLFVRK